jgi:hypothetical protein
LRPAADTISQLDNEKAVKINPRHDEKIMNGFSHASDAQFDEFGYKGR